ncbi:MAG: methyltransferase domain-containing protein [Casimicrobiaceae bacterium]
MKECSKSIPRRLADARFATRYFVGAGLDIGGRPDPLALYMELFPRIASVRTWDLDDGDAQALAGIAPEFFDFVHSSHCLEHLVDPRAGLPAWFRAVKPGGHLIVTLPDEDLYEQGVFPSTFNRDHKHTFTIHKTRSWSAASINVTDLLADLGPAAQVLKIELLDGTYRFGFPRYDQTQTPVTESGIEFVVRKRPASEIRAGGRLPTPATLTRETRIHLNQYRDDLAVLKSNNLREPPFANDGDV